MRLNLQDCTDIQAHIDLTKERLAQLGLSLFVDNDMTRFSAYLRRQPKTHGVPNTHDPELTYLHPGNSFWVYVRDNATDRIVACHGQRLLVTDDFIEDCVTQTYFEDLTPTLDQVPIGLYPEAAQVRIGGRVLLGGGLYVHPDWRARGLLIFNRCSRSIAIRHFRGDFLVGTLLNTPNRQGMAMGGVAYSHWVPCIRGGLPGKPQASDVIMAWSSRAEWLSTIRRDLAARDAGRPRQVRPAVRRFPQAGAAAAGSHD
jgi:hypothetical protein